MTDKMPDKIWVHKQSEVIKSSKPKGLMSALYDEYTRTDLVDELLAASEDKFRLNRNTGGARISEVNGRYNRALAAITGDKPA